MKDLVLPLLPAISDMFSIPAVISVGKDLEKVSFENLQLSTQGAERQRKDLLKTALRFEKLVAERRATSTGLNDSEILSELILKFNGFQANAAIKKWQVGTEARLALEGIICGMTPEARSLIQAHLDFNKWEESLRWGEDQWNKNVDHCALAMHVVKAAREDPRVTEVMVDEMLAGFMSGCLSFSTSPIPLPSATDAERDLGEVAAEETPDAPETCDPPVMSEADFKAKYPDASNPLVVTLSLGPGQPITCTYVDGKVFLSSKANTRILGATTPNAKPLFLYAGGTWIADSAKADVVLEEQTSTGAQDVGPMTVYELLVSFEKRGHLDLTLTGHKCERPPEVKRGERADAINVVHDTHSIFKPNAVLPKNAKGTNVAGVIGLKTLASSSYVSLLWRHLAASLFNVFC
eukprot:Skav223158  [mRNA]  locus=scaffold2973:257878:262548:- [translate_table: standard]